MSTIRSKLLVVCALLLLVSAAGGFVANWSTGALGGALDSNTRLARALRHHGSADMMRDGLRSNVYRALHAARTEPGQRAAIAGDLKQHLDQFAADIAEVRSLDLPSGIVGALEGLDQPLKAYAASAAALVEAAFTRPDGVQALLTGFNDRFAALEVAMKGVSDRLQALAEAGQRDAEDLASRATWLNMAATILAIALVAGAGLYVLRGIVAPIGAITDTVNALAAGDRGVVVEGTRRRDEVGRIARAVQVFKDGAIEMDRLQGVQSAQHERTEHERRWATLAIAAELEGELNGIVLAVSKAAQ